MYCIHEPFLSKEHINKVHFPPKAINLKVEDVFRSNAASNGQSIEDHLKYVIFFNYSCAQLWTSDTPVILPEDHSFPSPSSLPTESQITPFGKNISFNSSEVYIYGYTNYKHTCPHSHT